MAERTAAFPAGKWRVIFYDKYGREAIRGIATLTDNDLNLLKSKAYLMSVTDGENLVYNISETPVANKLSPERICLYDSYYFQNKISYQNFIPDSIAGETYLQHPKGLPTMTIDYTTDGKTDLLVNYYDSLGRVRQWRKSRGGLLTSRSISYTYSGAVATEMSSVVEPKRGKQKFMTVRYSYTNSEKVRMAHSIYHGCDTATVRYSYNQGRLSRQNFGKDWQHTALRQLSYDEHSWLKETKTTIPIKRTLIEIDSALVSPRFYSLIGNISDDEFQIESVDDYPLNPPSPNVVYTETLYYTDGKNPKYNGTPSGRSLPRRGHYWYSYDNLERLVKADYTPLGKQDDDFSTEYTYDIMSRPLSVKRYGVVDYDGRNEIFGVLDNISFRYENGLLSSISSNTSSVEGSNYFGRPGWQGSLDTDGTDVSFNDAGFLLGEIGRDFNSATYSHNSRALRFGASDSPDSPAIEMSYDSQGNLLSRSEIYKYVNVNKTIQRRFADIFTFRNDTLERIDFPGGYFDENGKAHYLLADYLGNVTMQLDADGHLERNISYYPYGEVHRQPAGQQLTLFGGKERVTHILGGSYDYGPRYLD
ncbi:MAG: hypothetical protein K2F78_07175, partial [Muribaculaceae bacterium]|nr:hypothetical protein [Muribaculaceae bacterium]